MTEALNALLNAGAWAIGIACVVCVVSTVAGIAFFVVITRKAMKGFRD